ncbi:STAS domain-containing protein [Streptomyces sp. CB00455]|uniref:STAS domain-containing protein n=1 Tax=Streptomyces sp. CB00455 TaxID=1703927 RepID=UPI000938DB8B|nr:STAS domain-containing protein [Streptomyces sp. CB00455]
MTHPDHGAAPGGGTAPRVTVEITPGPRRATARVGGEIDADNAHEVRADLTAAIDASEAGIDLDLASLSFCDSSSLHLLLDLSHLATVTGKTLVLESVPPHLSRLLDITGTARAFTIRTSPGDREHPLANRPGSRGEAGAVGTEAPRLPHRVDPAIAYGDEP